jgi:cellulose synthase/poly-beta-1,6-N-acetylglucosamine synthase-like glycosyltransferase
MRLIFWASVGVLFHTYLVYPLLLAAVGCVKQLKSDLGFGLNRRTRRAGNERTAPPLVSMVFAAHDEESVIARKMSNCAKLNYPRDALEVLVGCDGCTDATASCARAAALPNVRVYEFADRAGKPAVLNNLVPLAGGEIVVLCDANTEIEPDAIQTLVRHFRNPDVGCVCGELRLRANSVSRSCEPLYWRYETLLKFLESRSNMLIGANGALFAIRRSLFVPVPADGIVEDLLIALNVRAHGFRVVYDPEAVAWEEVAPSASAEFTRRVRIGAGNFSALRHTWRLLSPHAGRVALAYWSHKIFRWFAPVALVAIQISALALARDPLYGCAAAAGGVLLLLAWQGRRLAARGQHWAPAAVAYYFVAMNAALFLGLIAFLRGTQSIVWARTPRMLVPSSAAPVAAAAPPTVGRRPDAAFAQSVSIESANAS